VPPDEPPLGYRRATPGDIGAIAALHADSWRRHYRGAYSDDFLDHHVWDDQLITWTGRLQSSHPDTCTIVAERDGEVVGLVHLVFADDPTWGALIDNLHVTHELKGEGIGTRLMSEAARALLESDPTASMYLWVLEQNTQAQAFYDERRGTCVERQSRSPDPGFKLRYAWSDPSHLIVGH
jgi:predicted N-acetyltransferase YhbS